MPNNQHQAKIPTTNILFVCRGNVFRSFMAETLLRSRQLPNVIAMSAGTVAAKYYQSNANIYKDMRAFLGDHRIAQFAKDHYGDQLTQELLDKAGVVVLLNDIVRKEVLGLGLVLPAVTQVWDIADSDEIEPMPQTPQEMWEYKEYVFRTLDALVDKLIATRATE